MSKLAFTESPCPPSQPGPLNRSPSVSVGIELGADCPQSLLRDAALDKTVTDRCDRSAVPRVARTERQRSLCQW